MRLHAKERLYDLHYGTVHRTASAKKTGKTTVTVTDVNGKTATLNVTVKKAPTKKNFKLAKSSVSLKKKQTYQIALKKSVACQKMTYTLSKAVP